MTSFNLTTSQACIMKAGAGASQAISGALLALYCDYAEGSISALTKYDWVNKWSTVNTNFKGFVSDVVSDMVALQIVLYDTRGYALPAEGQTIINVLYDKIKRGISALDQSQYREIFTS